MLISLIVVVVVVMVSLVNTGRNLKCSRKSFQEEMALRLDLEEKISGMEKERSSFQMEIKDMKRSLERKSEEIDSLQEKIFKEQQEKKELNKALRKSQEQLDALATLSQQL
ncbi:MAG: hypothetical protein ABIC68_02265 [Candidatus Omnitrophota bacterium]